MVFVAGLAIAAALWLACGLKIAFNRPVPWPRVKRLFASGLLALILLGGTGVGLIVFGGGPIEGANHPAASERVPA